MDDPSRSSHRDDPPMTPWDFSLPSVTSQLIMSRGILGAMRWTYLAAVLVCTGCNGSGSVETRCNARSRFD